MTKLSPEEHAELEQLRANHLGASGRAAEMLRKYGSDSPQFGEADKIAAEISARIQKLEAQAGKS